MPEINLLESQSLLYVKPTIQVPPCQGHSVPSLQSNTDFLLKGKFSISKDLIVWSFKNNSRWQNFRTENILLQEIFWLYCNLYKFSDTTVLLLFSFKR